MAGRAKKKKLKRSKADKMVFGVLGGFAEKYDMDVTLLRIGWLIVVAFTGFIPGIIVYFLAAVIMPK